MVLVFIILVLFVIFAAYKPPFFFIQYLQKITGPSVLWTIETERKMIGLTIDDAPTDDTMEILEILKKYNAKATFYIIGSYVNGREDILKAIVEGGHEMGNHTLYDRVSAKLTEQELEAEIEQVDAIIQKYNPQSARWFRPGSGFFTARMMRLAQKLGYTLTMGSLYPWDAQIRNSTLNSLYLKLFAQSGDIVIIHDRGWTPPMLEKALPSLTTKFKIVTLSELVDAQKENTSTEQTGLLLSAHS